MSLRVAAKFARRELRGGLAGFRIFIACLALGVAAIAGVGSVRSAIEAGLADQGAVLLGGDAEVQFTYRFATPEERDWLESVAEQVSEVTDFRSMVVVDPDGEPERGLTQVKSVDSAYPLKGEILLDPPMPLADALATGDLPGAVMAPVLADRLGLGIGERFRLGTQDFVLNAVIAREPDNSGAGFSLGPRTMVRTDALADSGLLTAGTLFDSEYRLALAPGTDLDALKAEAKERYRDTGLRWRDARNGAPGVSRFVERLGAFLVLVGLSGLAVGGVGVSAAVRAYLAGKTSVIATLRTLGASRATIFQTYFLQIGALSIVGIGLGLVLGACIPLLFAPLITASLPVPALFALHPAPLVEAAIYGALTALVFTLWPLARAEEVRAATLFRDALDSAKVLPARRYVAATVLLALLLMGTAMAFSGRPWLTLWTAGGILGSLILLSLAAAFIRWLARRRPRRPGANRFCGGRWGRSAAPARVPIGRAVARTWSFGACGGGPDRRKPAQFDQPRPAGHGAVLFLGGHPEGPDAPTIWSGWKRPRRQQDRQRADAARGRHEDQRPPAEEVAGDHWVVRGDRGITYAELPGEDAGITAGEWWPEDYDGPPLVSFAAEEAEEMGLSLGDTVTVNILGRDITATIERRSGEVDFSSAGMGFVMSMDPVRAAGRTPFLHRHGLCRHKRRRRRSCATSPTGVIPTSPDLGPGRHRAGERSCWAASPPPSAGARRRRC